MSTAAAAAKVVASTETVKAEMRLAASKRVKSLKERARGDASREEAQRRKWGVETGALRSVHARKF